MSVNKYFDDLGLLFVISFAVLGGFPMGYALGYNNGVESVDAWAPVEPGSEVQCHCHAWEPHEVSDE